MRIDQLDVVLRARMRTAGEMDVDGVVELERGGLAGAQVRHRGFVHPRRNPEFVGGNELQQRTARDHHAAGVAVASGLGIALGLWLGWSVAGSAVFGLALSVASTVVLLRALQARDMVETEKGRIAVGYCSSLMSGNLKHVFTDYWTCNGFVPVTYLTMPPWLRTRAG